MDQPGLRRNGPLLTLVGVTDVVIGLVLVLVGVTQDIDGLVVGGVALTLVGAGVATVVTLARNRPEKH